MLFEATEHLYTANLAEFSNVEYAMASIYEARGFYTIHHDYYLFHESAKTKYPENEETLRGIIGGERLSALREVCRTLYPMDAGPGQRPEQPDLFVYRPSGEFFFSEVKRKKTGDYLRGPQMVGISLKPSTPFIEIMPYLDKIDLVLVMSVEPGFGGQGYIKDSTKRIAEIKKYLKDNCLERVQIQVDGGIKLHNAKEVILAGGDILVAGSEVFGSKNPQKVIKDFYASAKSINAS